MQTCSSSSSSSYYYAVLTAALLETKPYMARPWLCRTVLLCTTVASIYSGHLLKEAMGCYHAARPGMRIRWSLVWNLICTVGRPGCGSTASPRSQVPTRFAAWRFGIKQAKDGGKAYFLVFLFFFLGGGGALLCPSVRARPIVIAGMESKHFLGSRLAHAAFFPSTPGGPHGWSRGGGKGPEAGRRLWRRYWGERLEKSCHAQYVLCKYMTVDRSSLGVGHIYECGRTQTSGRAWTGQLDAGLMSRGGVRGTGDDNPN